MRAILLGAGLSTRMGKQKLLLPINGKKVIDITAENLHAAGFEEIYAVLSQQVAEAWTPLPPFIRAEVNPAPERGQSSSLAIGLGMLEEGEDFCLMLADLPLVGPSEIRALREAFDSMPKQKTVLAPNRNGIFGHPMLYRSLWRQRFRDAAGDMGGRNILKQYEREILRIEAPACHFLDMDTPGDYEKLKQTK